MNHAALIIVLTADGKTVVGRRRKDASFLGGYTVFPGGSIHEGESTMLGALRELWEETGLILDGDRLRDATLAHDGTSLEAVHHTLGVPIDTTRLELLARWVTPTFSPIRFDTACFLLRVASCDSPRVAQGELESPALARPIDLVEAWRRFDLWLAPPTWLALEAMLPGPTGIAERFAAADGAQGQDVRYFSCTPGVRGVPLVTPTLPPALHTNCYLVGHRRLIAVDPATYDDSERHLFLTELGRLEQQGAKLESIVLTHHHGDHVGSAQWLAREKNVPIMAHAITRDLLGDRVPVTHLLSDGGRIDLGEPDAPFPLDVLFTPGHARGHVVLVDRRPGSRAMIVGDMVASIGTIIIDPPDGDMAEYLRQLRRMRAMEPKLLFPAHGMPVIEGIEKLEQYVAHRLKREALVLSALARADTVKSLVPIAYADTPEFLWPLAERSCLAHLSKLVEDGVATQQDDRFLPRA